MLIAVLLERSKISSNYTYLKGFPVFSQQSLIGSKPSSTRVNYFIGKETSNWKTNINVVDLRF